MSTSGANATAAVRLDKSLTRSALSGTGSAISRSNRPGRRSAGSMASGRLVAARTWERGRQRVRVRAGRDRVGLDASASACGRRCARMRGAPPSGRGRRRHPAASAPDRPCDSTRSSRGHDADTGHPDDIHRHATRPRAALFSGTRRPEIAAVRAVLPSTHPYQLVHKQEAGPIRCPLPPLSFLKLCTHIRLATGRAHRTR